MGKKKTKRTKKVFDGGWWDLCVDKLNWIVHIKESGDTWFYPSLDLALEDILDQFTKKKLSQEVWRSLSDILVAVGDLREDFWEKTKKLRSKPGGKNE